jgi:hypothetical protein
MVGIELRSKEHIMEHETEIAPMKAVLFDSAVKFFSSIQTVKNLSERKRTVIG